MRNDLHSNNGKNRATETKTTDTETSTDLRSIKSKRFSNNESKGRQKARASVKKIRIQSGTEQQAYTLRQDEDEEEIATASYLTVPQFL